MLASGDIEKVKDFERMSVGEYYDLLYVKYLQSIEMEKMYRKVKNDSEK